jgi:hypothetical protein
MEQQYNGNQAYLQQLLIKVGLIAFGVMALDNLLNEPSDTVNYILYYKGKKMYHGIAYEDCLDKRIYSHEYEGIIPFDDCVYDHPKTRTKAKELEHRRIRRDQTAYNSHHR